jgi:hypothetical protein
VIGAMAVPLSTAYAIGDVLSLDQLPWCRLGAGARLWLIVLRGYLVLAGGLVLVRIVALALGLP